VTPEITIELWFRTTAKFGPIWSIYDRQAFGDCLTLQLSDGKLCIIGAQSNAPDEVVPSCTEQTYADGAWHHAGVVTGASPLLFVDGQRRAAPRTVLWLRSTSHLDLGEGQNQNPACIAVFPTDPSCFLTGDLDEVRM
jgi:hypothetical protein